jgi:hypothetical protein
LLEAELKHARRSILPTDAGNRRVDWRGSGWDSSNASISTLTKNLDQALDLYADIIVNPIFPESELELTRKRTLALHSTPLESRNHFDATVYDRVFTAKNIHTADSSPATKLPSKESRAPIWSKRMNRLTDRTTRF